MKDKEAPIQGVWLSKVFDVSEAACKWDGKEDSFFLAMLGGPRSVSRDPVQCQDLSQSKCFSSLCSTHQYEKLNKEGYAKTMPRGFH